MSFQDYVVIAQSLVQVGFKDEALWNDLRKRFTNELNSN